jgi:hypothetical protein
LHREYADTLQEGDTPMGLNEMIPIPKSISPAKHAMLDYGVAATFLSLGFRFKGRNNAAAALAFISGGMVLGVSMATDYPGGIWKKISFQKHGILDMVQAALAAFGPLLFGFARTGDAKPFYAQASSEVGVIATTDWNGMQTKGAAV